MRKKPVERERYPQNAEGDFYVEKDLCMMCMMPEVEAPELMDFDQEAGNCYFKKQPNTPEELAHAIAAVASSEIQGLRYAGNDPEVLHRLVDAALLTVAIGSLWELIQREAWISSNLVGEGFGNHVDPCLQWATEQSLAADDAIACFSSNFFASA
jgi:hypothetical protein